MGQHRGGEQGGRLQEERLDRKGKAAGGEVRQEGGCGSGGRVSQSGSRNYVVNYQ